MPDVSSCPDVPVLEQFLLGQVPPDEAQWLARHVEECGRCVETLHNLQANDTLIESMRAAAAAATPPGGVWVDRVMAHARDLTGAPTPAGFGEACDFLAPPQGPDELGRLGSYRVLRVLGAGGMGIVLQAEDLQLKRPVALKALKPALAASDSARRRFLREAQATAAIRHDHIITIHQVDEQGGIPFLAMELLEGESLEARLQREGKLPTAEVIRIGREIAAGLAAAHARGLIHRDVKPNNVWLEVKEESGGGKEQSECCGSASSFKRVKILDFGLARAVGDDAHITQSGMIVGTPAYMAPEQGRGEAVDPRCDLFSLGCVLYRMTTGRAPFVAKDAVSTLLVVARDQPRPPRDVNPAVPPALSALVMRLLAKDPNDRPESAGAVIAELERIGCDRDMGSTTDLKPPTEASSPTGGEGIPRVVPVRRPVLPRRRVAVFAAAGLLMVLGGAAIILRITSKDGKVREVELQPGDKLEIVPPALPEDPKPARRQPVAGGSLFDALRREDIPPYELAAAGGGDPKQAPVELVAILGDSRMKHWWRDVNRPVFTPDSKTMISQGGGDVVFWDAATGKMQRRLPHLHVSYVSLSRDGKLLATSSADCIQLWDPDSGEKRRTILHGGSHAVVSPDGKTVAALAGPIIRIWDITTGRILYELHGHTTHPIYDLCFSPDSKTLASCGIDQTARLWEAGTGRELHVLKGHVGLVQAVAFSPDGKTVASAGKDGTVLLWDVATGKQQQALPVAIGTSVAFSPHGKTLAVGDWTGDVILCDLMTGKTLHRLNSGASDYHWVAFSPDGTTLAAGNDDGFVRLWDATTGKEKFHHPGHTSFVRCMALRPDGKIIATGSDDRTVKLWEVASGKVLRTLTGHGGLVSCVAFHPDGRTLASGSWDGTVKLWDVDTGEEERTLPGHGSQLLWVAFSPDGKTLAALGSQDQTIKLWDWVAGVEPQILKTSKESVSGWAFSPKGNALIANGAEGWAAWDVASGKKLHSFKKPTGGQTSSLAFSPDGSLLAGLGEAGLGLWDAATGLKRRTWPNPQASRCIFGRDGKTVMTFGWDGTLKFWDVDQPLDRSRPKRVLPLGPSQGWIIEVAVSPDGRHLVTLNGNGTLYVLRLATPPAK
jgi:WD40 repeat protein/serine/threonine protein kinase